MTASRHTMKDPGRQQLVAWAAVCRACDRHSNFVTLGQNNISKTYTLSTILAAACSSRQHVNRKLYEKFESTVTLSEFTDDAPSWFVG